MLTRNRICLDRRGIRLIAGLIVVLTVAGCGSGGGGGSANAQGNQTGTPPVPTVTAATTYSTNFPATETLLSQSGIWLNGLTDGLDWNDIQTSTNQAYAAAFDAAPGGVSDGVAQLKRTFLAFTSNQYAEGTVFVTYGASGPPSGTHEIEVFVNMTITPHSITGYECYVNFFNNHAVVRWNGAHNNFTYLQSNNVSNFTAPQEDDVIRIERNGNDINCYQNGILRTTATDTTYMGGNPGIGNNPVAPATLNGIGWKFFKAGNL